MINFLIDEHSSLFNLHVMEFYAINLTIHSVINLRLILLSSENDVSQGLLAKACYIVQLNCTHLRLYVSLSLNFAYRNAYRHTKVQLLIATTLWPIMNRHNRCQSLHFETDAGASCGPKLNLHFERNCPHCCNVWDPIALWSRQTLVLLARNTSNNQFPEPPGPPVRRTVSKAPCVRISVAGAASTWAFRSLVNHRFRLLPDCDWYCVWVGPE